MTLSTDEFGGPDKQRHVTRALRFSDVLIKLDSIIMAIAHATWQAVIDGLAAYGMAHCVSVVDFHPHQVFDSVHQQDEISMNASIFEMTPFDGAYASDASTSEDKSWTMER